MQVNMATGRVLRQTEGEMNNPLADALSRSNDEVNETLNEVRIALPGAQLLHIFLLHSSGLQRLQSMSTVLADFLGPRRSP